MTCRECEQILLDEAGRAHVSREALHDAQGHVEKCAKCQDKFNRIWAVDAALALLRKSTESFRASGELERRLVLSFRESAVPSFSFPAGWDKFRIFRWALAVALIVVGFIGYETRQVKNASSGGVTVTAFPAPNQGNSGIQRSIRPSMLAARRTPHKRRNMNGQSMIIAEGAHRPRTKAEVGRRVEQEDSDKATGEDVRLSTGTPMPESEGGAVLRVTLPASSLQMIGWPVSPDVSNHRITADIVVDPYGVVQRVTLVPPRTAIK